MVVRNTNPLILKMSLSLTCSISLCTFCSLALHFLGVCHLSPQSSSTPNPFLGSAAYLLHVQKSTCITFMVFGREGGGDVNHKNFHTCCPLCHTWVKRPLSLIQESWVFWSIPETFKLTFSMQVRFDLRSNFTHCPWHFSPMESWEKKLPLYWWLWFFSVIINQTSINLKV